MGIWVGALKPEQKILDGLWIDSSRLRSSRCTFLAHAEKSPVLALCYSGVWDGLIALYGLSKAFGDVLSYMRLFALGLSSVSLAITFNQLALFCKGKC